MGSSSGTDSRCGEYTTAASSAECADWADTLRRIAVSGGSACCAAYVSDDLCKNPPSGKSATSGPASAPGSASEKRPCPGSLISALAPPAWTRGLRRGAPISSRGDASRSSAMARSPFSDMATACVSADPARGEFKLAMPVEDCCVLVRAGRMGPAANAISVPTSVDLTQAGRNARASPRRSLLGTGDQGQAQRCQPTHAHHARRCIIFRVWQCACTCSCARGRARRCSWRFIQQRQKKNAVLHTTKAWATTAQEREQHAAARGAAPNALQQQRHWRQRRLQSRYQLGWRKTATAARTAQRKARTDRAEQPGGSSQRRPLRAPPWRACACLHASAMRQQAVTRGVIAAATHLGSATASRAPAQQPRG